MPGGGGGGRGDNGGTSASGANGQVTVTWSTCSTNLTSAANTNTQTVCPGIAISNITYSIVGATDATVSGLPTGVTFNYNNGTLTISGTPTVSGNFSYTVTPNAPCSGTTATGTITVRQSPIATVTNQTNITCFGANDGTITVSASAGTSPYTFSINNGANFFPATGTNLRLFTGLSPNTPFRIQVKDNNGCISR
jgi:hypothetical protein